MLHIETNKRIAFQPLFINNNFQRVKKIKSKYNLHCQVLSLAQFYTSFLLLVTFMRWTMDIWALSSMNDKSFN